MTVVREENGEEISEISVSEFNTVLTEVYNKALDNCEKIIANAYDNGYIDGFSLSIISANFQQLRR